MTGRTGLPDYIHDAFEQATGFRLGRWLIMLCVVGSDSHGTKIEKPEGVVDDTDWFGVVVPPPAQMLGVYPPQSKHHKGPLSRFDNWRYLSPDGQHDVVIYSLDKYLRMATRGAADALSALWLRPEDYVYRTAAWQRVAAHREMFVTRQVHREFIGWAKGQLERMDAYTPESDARMTELTATLAGVGVSVEAAMNNLLGSAGPVTCGWARELRELRSKYNQKYMGEKRRQLVRQHGYDTKQAGHVIRIVRMCQELLRTGQMDVFRTADADLIRDIKRGLYTLDAMKSMASAEIELADTALAECTLPFEPSLGAISQLAVEVYHEQWGSLMQWSSP